MKEKNISKMVKIIFIIILLILTISLKNKTYAAVYGKDYFGEEYSSGYVRDRNFTDVIKTSSGVSLKTGKQINSRLNVSALYYTSNNTNKSEYIDYSQAARYINSNGEPIWLDMRIYIWTNNRSYPWAMSKGSLYISNFFSVTQHTTMEFHFYTIGHCGEADYEQIFKGVIKMSDLDAKEGFMIYSGYNQFYLQSGIPVTYIPKGNTNSTNGNNPFSTSGTAAYPYFFGTRDNNNTDGVWIEINSTLDSPFKITYGTKGGWFGMSTCYTGTAIEYYVDGELKDRAYCVPYGKYRLIDTTKLDAQKYGYNIDGWYTDTNYTTKAQNGIAGTSTIRVYGKYIRYTITVDNEREGHTYNSYQVFQGDYHEKEDENGNKIPTLSNIEWSSELQKETEDGKTHGDKILELLQENEKDKVESNKLYSNCKTAEDIANVLKGKPNDGEVIREFTDIVGKYILDNDIPIAKGTSTVVQEKDKNGNIVSNYKIKDLNPGYYIVIDAKANDKDDAYSRYLIDVVQDVIMEPKTSIPRLNKKVKGNNIKTLVSGVEGESSAEYLEDEKRNTATYKKESEEYNAEDYDIEFELKSYIPDVTGYSAYKFEVVDILSKGFDFDRNSVKVMLGENDYPRTREKIIKDEKNEETSESTNVENTEEIINPENAQENGEEIIQNSESKKEIVENYVIRDVVITESNYETYKTYFEEEVKEYPEGYAESNYGKTLILIELKDLVEQVNDGIVKKGQDIFIRYKAKLNGKGEVGNTPNINEAYVKYSNNPYNSESITQTTTETTYTYTIDLNINKIAEIKKSINNSNSENENLVEDTENSEVLEQLNYLEGAEFEIYNGPEYIKGDSLLPVKNPNRKLIATIKTDEIIGSEGKLINKAGQALYSSLGAGTYYIKETKSPEGYNKLREEIELEVKATCNEYGEIKWTVKNAENNLVLAQIGIKEIIKENVDKETGEITTEIVKTEIPEIKLQVENTSGLQLPVTGGTGIIVFEVLGISIMMITVISLISNIKKKN